MFQPRSLKTHNNGSAAKVVTLALIATFGSIGAAKTETLNPQSLRLLAENCASTVSPDIVEKIVRTESGFNRFAIGVNGADRRSYAPETKSEAVRIARDLIAAGKSIDMGLGQINSANLQWLNLTVETVFDSCENLRASETVLRDGYDRARAQGADPDTALRQALSAYNTGSFTRGFSNGYVARVMGANVATDVESAPPAPENPPPSWDVFSTATPEASTSLVFN